MTCAAIAKEYAAAGFYVIPVGTDKRPCLPSHDSKQWWPRRATRSADVINHWWSRKPGAQVGIYTGRFGERSSGKALCVLDIDMKDGKDGEATLRALANKLGPLPPTRETTTPTGGRHLFFITDSPLKTTKPGDLGEGLDIRADRAQVVAAGSITPKGEYRLTVNVTPAPLPASWEAAIGAARVKTSDKSRAVHPLLGDHLDDDDAVSRATQYLKAEAPVARQFEGGAHTLQIVAARCGDFGCSSEQTLESIKEHYNDRCEPAWSLLPDEKGDDDISRLVRNSFIYCNEKPIGCDHPTVKFPETDDLPPLPSVDQAPAGNTTPTTPTTNEPKPTARKLTLLPFESIAALATSQYLVKGWLDKGGLSVWYGPPGAGKSWAVLDLALHVAAHRPWHGHKVRGGPVVYAATEAVGSIASRIQAARNHHRFEKAPELYLVAEAAPVFHGVENLGALVDAIRGLDRPPVLVVVDTLACAAGSFDENSGKDMSSVITAAKVIQGAFGAHTLLVHHAGKDVSRGSRGHSSLKGAVDQEVEVDQFQVRMRKNRDGKFPKSLSFEVQPVELGVDEDGDIIRSGVVALTQWPEEIPEDLEAGNALDASECLARLIAEHGHDLPATILAPGDTKCVTESLWKDRFRDQLVTNRGVKKKSTNTIFNRAREELIKRGLVVVDQGVVYFTPKRRQATSGDTTATTATCRHATTAATGDRGDTTLGVAPVSP